MELQEDPFAKYGGTEVKASDGDPFAKYGGTEVKDNHTLTSTPTPTTLPFSQPSGDLSPILPQYREEYKQQQQAKAQAVTDHFKQLRAELPKESQDNWDKATQLATRQPDELNTVSKADQDHYNFMQTPVGKTLGAVAYLGSKATKGTLQVAKGAAYLADLGVSPTHILTGGKTNGVDEAFSKADKAADFGLTKGDQQRIGDNPIMSNLGGLAEFLPAAAAASGTGGATLYLQGLGQGKDAIDQVEKSGAKVNPLVKNAFILGTGAVNGYLMGDLGNSVFKSLPAGLRGDITASITADAIKQASGKELTGQSFKELLDKGAKDFGDKLAKGGISTLEGYKHAVTNLSGLAGANFALKKGVDLTNDKPVFNEHLGDLASNLNDIATKQAPFFAIPAAIGAASKLTPYSGYKNSVVESLMHDNSPENIEKVKNDISDYGQQNDWHPEEIQATIDHVGKIADIAKSLPKNLPENKMTDAVDLVQGRNQLQSELDEARKQIDPALQDHLSPNEQLISDKIEQANDKLRALVTGNKLTVSKGVGDDEGNFFKTIGGKQEPIEESRYKLDALERDAKAKAKSEDELTAKLESTPIPKFETIEHTGDKMSISSIDRGLKVLSEKEQTPEVKRDFEKLQEYRNKVSDIINNHNSPITPIENESTNESNGEKSSQESNEKGNAESKKGSQEDALINSGADKTVPDNSFKDKIANLFSKLKGTSKQTKEVVSEVSSEEAKTVKEKTGLDIDGYRHIIDNFGINHTLTKHGDEKSESNRGQIAVTQSDFERIPEIIKNPDSIENAGKNKLGRDVIRYSKTYPDGTTFYIEEVRNAKKELALETLYKRKNKKGDGYYADSVEPPSLSSDKSETSETASPIANIDNSDKTNNSNEPTGIRNADVETERGEAIPRDKMSKQAIEAEGKRLVDSGDIDPDELANRVISSKKPITAEEQAALLYHKVKLKNRQREILKDENPENITENQIEYAKNEDLLDRNQQATEIAGNVTGRALGFRTETMNDDFSRNSVFRRAKLANNGVELDAKDKSALEDKTKRIDELENQLLDREEQIRKLHDQTTISKVKRTAELQEREAKRDITKASLRKEREGLLAELHLQAKKSRGELGANKIPLEMAPTIAKLARNYVLDGVVSLSSVVDKLYNDLKDHIDGLDKKELSDLVKDNFDKYLAEQNQVRLDRSKKLQSKKLTDLKDQLESGNYEKKIQRKIQVDNDYLKIRAEINRQQLLINKKIEEIANSNKSAGRKAVDFAVKWGRNAKLASITVLGKLAATGLTTMGLKTITEGIGKGISAILPTIADKSKIEGSIHRKLLHEAARITKELNPSGNGSVKSISEAYARAATIGMKDAWDEINIKKGGQSDLSALYGKYTVGRLPAEAADFFGHLHSSIKAPIKRFTWEHSYAKRIAKGIQQGLDVQDPVIDAKNRLDAYKDAERAIFMGDNLISKGYEAAMKTLENSTSGSAKNIAALTRILLPFVKVPTNIALSTGRYAFGSVMGLSKLAQIGTSSALKTVGAETMAKVIHAGMGELTPEESDMVLRNLKHGSIGGAALLIGFYNPKNVGGFYQEHEKRKPGDANVGSLKLFGHKIPVFLTEHPIFQAMQIGATFRRVLDAHRHKEDKVSAAALATASGLAEGIPLAKEAKQITDMFGSDTHKINTFISNAVKGEIEPALIQQIAIATDTKNGDAITFDDKNQVKRNPNKKKGLWKYMKQDLATGIPGARETVPEK